MSETAQQEMPATGWRFRLGIALFVLSILVPVLGVPLLGAFGVSTGLATSLTAALLISAEVLGVAAVAVMGKEGFAWIKSRFSTFLRQYGPPNEVSRVRYTIGLVMFSLPLVFGWAAPYFGEHIPGFIDNQLVFYVCGDLLFLTSLFVLGGDFWDKLRALFVHRATAVFPQKRDDTPAS
jgi:hypothetical protein